MLVSLLLLSIVLGLTTAFFAEGAWRVNFTTGYEQELYMLRQGLQRMTQELREANLIESSSTGTTITFWVDLNHDQVEQPTEVITYTLVTPNGSSTAQLERYTQASGPTNYTVIASSLVQGTVFNYAVSGVIAPLSSNTNSVLITLTGQVRNNGQAHPVQSVSTLVDLRG